ncbi:hypothetical protein [Bdellovibrio svalbardensis]|uniref:DUF306 domain-containing protein n=1 Tax=Bdellovibrio svalbardensis TaxID=2972972 RepID=A0ABT6DE41_9BACT|nr:hypothetical protein [Bdellovibrio svalbardensis]MDG0815099.1 hypothetical protein [Bdellovibrio svalbardensis]
MMKYILTTALLMLSTSQAFATELSPGNLPGHYKVQAKAGFQTVYVNFRVLDQDSFEFQRTYPDGRKDELCDGSYTLTNSFYLNDYAILAANKAFRGKMTCPSDRSKKIDFNIDFASTTVEDLVRGTTVSVTSSLAPGMRLSAYVKKQ